MREEEGRSMGKGGEERRGEESRGEGRGEEESRGEGKGGEKKEARETFPPHSHSATPASVCCISVAIAHSCAHEMAKFIFLYFQLWNYSKCGTSQGSAFLVSSSDEPLPA